MLAALGAIFADEGLDVGRLSRPRAMSILDLPIRRRDSSVSRRSNNGSLAGPGLPGEECDRERKTLSSSTLTTYMATPSGTRDILTSISMEPSQSQMMGMRSEFQDLGCLASGASEGPALLRGRQKGLERGVAQHFARRGLAELGFGGQAPHRSAWVWMSIGATCTT